MYLRLSDGVPTKQATKKEGDDQFPYVFIPQTRTYIREDYLMDLFTPEEFRVLMAQLAAYQPQVESGQQSMAQFMCDKTTRKQRREDKHNKKDAKTEIKKAKAEAKKSGRGADVLGTIVDGVKSFMKPSDSTDNTTDQTTNTTAPPPDMEAEKAWYEKPAGMIGIALGTATVVGVGIHLATKHS